MFGSWGLVNPSNQTDRSTIRNSVKRHRGPLPFPPLYSPPPPPPSSSLDDPEPIDPFTTGLPPDHTFYRFFQQIRRITDVTPAHFAALNITIQQNLPLSSIIDSRFIPEDNPELLAELTAAAASNARPVRNADGTLAVKVETKEEKDTKEWIERCRECLIDNDTAFQAAARIRRDIKLGNLYRFYQALEMVDPYYDLTPLSEEELAKSEGEGDAAAAGKKVLEQNGNGKRPASPELMEVDEKPAGDADGDVEMTEPGKEGESASTSTATTPASAATGAPPPKDRSKEKWNMPERFREDMIKNFIDPLCWNYQIRVFAPRAAPKLALQSSLFSVHLTDYLHRPSPIPQEARKGIVFGPILGTQVRHEHSFRRVSDFNTLLLSRRRKMLTNAKPSAKKQRSSPSSSSSRRSSSSREKEKAEKEKAEKEKKDKEKGELASSDDDALDPTEGLLLLDSTDTIGAARLVTALLHLAQLRNLQQGPTNPDNKLNLCALGRVHGSAFDDVYLITGRHHHIAIAHARVSDAYLRFLRTGRVKKGGEEGWEKLVVGTTTYWDLMVPEERVEAARAVTAVLRRVNMVEEENKAAEAEGKEGFTVEGVEKDEVKAAEEKEEVKEPEARQQVELRA
ncbi:hypothetical protein EX30DRAFT_245521 [Ascodesmis nigricans]|uniref:Uncharacterized protein n=1 Tax=Ascodesmis nigricans TaxID=341454 RepID=A0A4S2MPT2_9PEZI|nr:hypothetical protein EX30DRAFT_245521 [Ascodesmis nigricans]